MGSRPATRRAIAYLLFAKMFDEQSRLPLNQPNSIHKGHDRESLLKPNDDVLETHQRHLLARDTRQGRELF